MIYQIIGNTKECYNYFKDNFHITLQRELRKEEEELSFLGFITFLITHIFTANTSFIFRKSFFDYWDDLSKERGEDNELVSECKNLIEKTKPYIIYIFNTTGKSEENKNVVREYLYNMKVKYIEIDLDDSESKYSIFLKFKKYAKEKPIDKRKRW